MNHSYLYSSTYLYAVGSETVDISIKHPPVHKASMMRRLATRSVGAVAIGGGATAVYAYNTDPGFRRQCKFWQTVAPTAAQYMACSMRHKKSDATIRAEAFAKLHATYAPVSLELILSLRGLYIKFGQAAASSPFVPGAYRSQFKQLQSDVPSEDFASIRQVIEEDLGPIERTFASFSQTAIGAASTGQAHVAKLHTGEDVVVKVQYKDAASVFGADMQCLRALVRLTQPDALPAFAEFESQLALELDYGQELRNLDRIADAVMPRYADRVVVPFAHHALCSKRVLTMQYLAGPKLEGAMRERMAALGMNIDEKETMRDWLMRLDTESREAEEAEEVVEGRASRLGRLASRLVGVDAAVWVVDKVLSLCGRHGPTSTPAAGPESVEGLRRTLHSLLEVHGFEMFVSGLFNADPHPGNLIAMADGRVGLIDYGQCKLLEPEPREAIAALIVKIADEAPHAEVAEAFRRVGVRTEKDSDEFLGNMAVRVAPHASPNRARAPYDCVRSHVPWC